MSSARISLSSCIGKAPTFLISNIASLVSVRLENRNHLLWKFQFLLMLRANGLIEFVDGTNPCPSEFLVDENDNYTKEPNPRFPGWIQQDQNVLCLINATYQKVF